MTTETYKKLELNAEQLATLTHLKQYFPYRICYGAINESGDFLSGAVVNMRQPNDLVRRGYTVYTC
jgi:hypothetical protein